MCERGFEWCALERHGKTKFKPLTIEIKGLFFTKNGNCKGRKPKGGGEGTTS